MELKVVVHDMKPITRNEAGQLKGNGGVVEGSIEYLTSFVITLFLP